MAPTPTATLAEVASTYSSLMRELERLGLDDCCCGRRCLEEGSQQQGLDLEAVVAELVNHLGQEEGIILPMIRTLASTTSRPSFDCGSIAKPIAVLELTNGGQAPADTCTSAKAWMAGLAELEGVTHLHAHRENKHLFPTVKVLEKQ